MQNSLSREALDTIPVRKRYPPDALVGRLAPSIIATSTRDCKRLCAEKATNSNGSGLWVVRIGSLCGGSAFSFANFGCSLFFRELPPHVQAVEIEQRVEHQRIIADGFGAVDGIRGKQNHVAASYRH